MREAFEAAWRALGVPPGSGVVAGVSGGVDSAALLHCLCALRDAGAIGALHAAHLNHGIRGARAKEDARFVQALCAQWDVPCVVAHADVPALAARGKQSMEEAARAARYAFLERARAQCGADYIAVAHHAGDQAETVLLHLLRGAGLNGLCGMRAKNGRILRPLLGVSRGEIEAYARANAIPHCTDETNADARYLRNRVRLSLLPLLQAEYNPAVERALCRTAALCAQDEDFLMQAARSALTQARLHAGGFSRSALAALPPALQGRAARLLLAQAGALYDAGQPLLDRLCGLFTARTGARLRLSGETWAWTSYDALHVGALREPEAFCVPFVAEGVTALPCGRFVSGPAAARRDEGAAVAYLDFDCLPEGLSVRTRRPGDRFHPLGAPGARKLKAYFIDKKIPRQQRMGPMLCAGEDVLFLPGLAIAHPVRVTEGTKRILRVAFEPDGARCDMEN